MKNSINKHINIVGINKNTNKIIGFGSVIIVNTLKDGKVGKI